MTSPTPQVTDFTRDVLGRYICNGLDEALRSTDTSLRADARPFDVIVIGGGSFGSAFAQHLFSTDVRHSHRVLVLEGGPLLVPEHVQNLPLMGLAVPGDTSIKNLRDAQPPQDRIPRAEVWGLPWHSNINFTGLAYCLGGRSLYWGGWAPQLLDAELAQWPQAVVEELDTFYFHDAAEQTGVTQTNDFISGPMHEALRQRLFDGLAANKVTDAIALPDLPLHLDGLGGDIFKLEAPLAVQASSPRPGFFPFNKFSDLPLLIRAARSSYSESGGDDVKRRLMVVPQCHVMRLGTLGGGRVVSVETSQGSIPVPQGGVVVLALGTIESARLALGSFPDPDGTIGRNLMVHLRSNLTVRIPRTSFPELAGLDLEESALFVKGSHTRKDGSVGFFHLQITAAGLGSLGTDSEAELFKKIPDIDLLHTFRAVDETSIVVTIRGIGEMQSGNPGCAVRLDPEADEYGVQRAFVSVADPRAGGNPNDLELWDAMDAAADQVAAVLAGTSTFQVLGRNRDGLGTTHHEAGTLRMGTDPATSVTNTDCRLHHVENAYVAGPALWPRIGSPNPMLTGVALARRLGDHIAPAPTAPTVEQDFTAMFDGYRMAGWRMAGDGVFLIVDGALEAEPGGGLGLLWHTTPLPPDFVLRLQWLRYREDDNSGVFVRFPDPNSKGYQNTAWVGVDFGFEIQIDETARPDGAPYHRTGAIYGEAQQQFNLQPARAPGEWNDYEIRVQGQTYTVMLNGVQVTQYENQHSGIGLASTPEAPSYFGLQAHTGRVSFRNIRIQSLTPAKARAAKAAAKALA